MDRITLQNYRCFDSAEQTARLAPLTLLVGPNSTGKTSFLALIRALWDVAFREVVPNFREEPYDLGSFEDIVHRRGGRDKTEESFNAGFEYTPPAMWYSTQIAFSATFANRWTAPYPVSRCIAGGGVRIEIPEATPSEQMVRFWVGGYRGQFPTDRLTRSYRDLLLHPFREIDFSTELELVAPDDSVSVSLTDDETIRLSDLRNAVSHEHLYRCPPFGYAPFQSHPRRTYDPTPLNLDAEGKSVPSYLADLHRDNPEHWRLLKAELENFGRDSELFDEIGVRSFGKTDGDPFQIQVRKFGKRRKGPWRNLIDVGYGNSQVLPLIVEMLKRYDEPMSPLIPLMLLSHQPPMLLIQQPEVHLHPQAQAALGTLFCQVAAGGRQLVVETHSDHIIDRVRMDVRDQTTGLKPEDVSILYFEPGDFAVKIHSIRLDDMGNVLDAPPGYRQFFTDEMMRSIGL